MSTLYSKRVTIRASLWPYHARSQTWTQKRLCFTRRAFEGEPCLPGQQEIQCRFLGSRTTFHFLKVVLPCYADDKLCGKQCLLIAGSGNSTRRFERGLDLSCFPIGFAATLSLREGSFCRWKNAISQVRLRFPARDEGHIQVPIRKQGSTVRRDLQAGTVV